MKAAAACNKLAWLTCLGFSKAFLLPPSRGVGGTTGTFTRVLAVSSSRPRSRCVRSRGVLVESTHLFHFRFTSLNSRYSTFSILLPAYTSEYTQSSREACTAVDNLDVIIA